MYTCNYLYMLICICEYMYVYICAGLYKYLYMNKFYVCSIVYEKKEVVSAHVDT